MSKQINILFSDDELAVLDSLRGVASPQDYIRALVAHADVPPEAVSRGHEDVAEIFISDNDRGGGIATFPPRSTMPPRIPGQIVGQRPGKK